MKMLLYCTKAKPKLVEFVDEEVKKEVVCRFGAEYNKTNEKYYKKILNGKIMGECDFEVEKIETYRSWNNDEDFDIHYDTSNLGYDDLLKKTCLNNQQLDDYLQGENGYAIHIKNLVIYDKPRELNEFGVKGERVGDTQYFKTCEKAPQNMMNVLDDVEKKILISIRPQWLCKILNGEKTIEVRRKILKEMI